MGWGGVSEAPGVYHYLPLLLSTCLSQLLEVLFLCSLQSVLTAMMVVLLTVG